MTDMYNIKIDGIELQAAPGTTILEAAQSVGIEIPTLCHDKRIEEYGACGICVVEAAGVPKLLRACSTKITDGIEINTKSERVIRSRKFALDMLLSNHTGDCKAPCSLACPAGTDCQGYVGLIANGEYEEALKLIKKRIPLPAAIGRVCPHPCQTACRRSLVEDPIQIAYLKSFAADIDLNSENTYVPELAEPNGKKVSIVGGGPGGLTAAYFLRIKGYSVKIYDKMPKMGGMLRYGIPQYRLPKEILDKEIKLIENLGIEMINNKTLGKDFTLESLKAESDAVVVAVGAWKSSPMRVAGEELNGVYGGIDFLRSVIEGNPYDRGNRVAVCGGGNTAMDACRTAVRLGADAVYVVYRRTRDEMPAEELEIKEAEESLFEARKEQLERLSEFGSSYLDSQKTLLQAYFDTTNAVEEGFYEINKELETSKTMYEWLDEETRKLLFNQEDYNALYEELYGIQYKAIVLQEQYQISV